MQVQQEQVRDPLLNPFHCTFCGQGEQTAKVIITGPMVNICDDCVDLCVEVVEEHRAKPFYDLRNAP